MSQTNLVFIPSPGVGHLGSTVELAKVLISRDDRLSVTVIIMKMTSDSSFENPYLESQSSNTKYRLHFLDLNDRPPIHSQTVPHGFRFIADVNKPYVKDVVLGMVESGCKIKAFVIDLFCTSMIDVANEFNIPSYIYFTSGASTLGFMLHLQALRDSQNLDVTELKNSDELAIPSFVNLVPVKVFPQTLLDKEGGSTWFLNGIRMFREAKGILINTFVELESHSIESLCDPSMKCPPIYPVGPILNLEGTNQTKKKESDAIMKWLDDQPARSVVFLCFGSMGSFNEEQVRHIACALEKSGFRFLWSLRRPPEGKFGSTGEYLNPEEVLPEGFLEQTSEIGRVIGWAPQTAVLSHPSIGGFVSHCGWNSTLESLWFGVPVAAWPIYAEQQLNAFAMVKEFGMAAEVKMDYVRDGDVVAESQILKALKSLMLNNDEEVCEMRSKVKEMSKKSRSAVNEGGSSYQSLHRLIRDILDIVPLTDCAIV